VPTPRLSQSFFTQRLEKTQLPSLLPLQLLLQDVVRKVPAVGKMSGQLRAPPLIPHQAQDLSLLVSRTQLCTGTLPVQLSTCHSQLPGLHLFPQFPAEHLAAPSHHALEARSHRHVFWLLVSLKYFSVYQKLSALSLSSCTVFTSLDKIYAQ